MNKTLFSIIMPAYNAEKYISEAIDSVVSQTYENWELIIVDDGSMDGTVSIIENNYKDKRIILVKQEHKGTAGAARNTALSYVKGQYVQILDSDDFLGENCLEKYWDLLNSSKKDLDIIVPVAYAVDDFKNVSQQWNRPDDRLFISGANGFDYSVSWKIHGWFCVKADLLKEIKYEDEIVNGDELTTRKLLYNANIVSFSEGEYFYRINSNSTTRSIENRVKMFDVQKTAYKLFQYSKINSMKYKTQRICAIHYANVLMNNIINYISIKDELDVKSKEYIYLMLNDGVKKFKLIMFNFSTGGLLLLCGIKNLDFTIFLYKVLRKIKCYLKKIINRNNGIQEIKRNEKNQRKIVCKRYTEKEIKVDTKRVIVIFNGDIAAGGLCDRLRGVVSIYQSCKANGVRFSLIFNSPFNLEYFMEPNEYDWYITENELCYDKKSKPIFINSKKGDEKEACCQKKCVDKLIKKEFNQLHFYTNAHYSLYSDSYSTDFNELFKPSTRILNELKKYIPENEKYVSASFRFLQLLGDFDEKYKDIYTVLPEVERRVYINKSIKFLNKLYESEKKKIFVATDSKTFLEEANKLPFVFIVPGDIVHVDASKDVSFDSHKKTFIDFYMIANADKVYLGHTGAMHYSGFPKNAALLSGKEFEIVEY